MRTRSGYNILAIIAAAILLMVSSVNHPIIGQQIKETIADAIEGEPTWTYYNQVRANKGLTPEEAREKGSHKFDGPDEDGNDPYERCEQQVANGEYDTILEAVLAEFDRTHRPSSGEADPARLGSTLTAHEETIKSIDQSKLSDEEKQRLNLIVMPDEHDEVVGKRPNAFMNHAERGMSGYEYAEKGYELMVENHKLATPSIEKIEDSYTSQTFQEPYSLEMGGNRPKVVVEQSVHEGGYMLVWTYPDGTREEYRINCGFQWINTQDHGWTPLEWNPPPSDYPPSDNPPSDNPPAEELEDKDESEEYQKQNGSESPSVNGANDNNHVEKGETEPPDLKNNNPSGGRGDNPPAPQGDSDGTDDPEEASAGTESGSKIQDSAPEEVTVPEGNHGDFSEKRSTTKEPAMKTGSSGDDSNSNSGNSGNSGNAGATPSPNLDGGGSSSQESQPENNSGDAGAVNFKVE